MTATNARKDRATRVIASSPAAIYAAFADGRTLMRWLPPKGMSGRALAYDFWQGGRYRIELRYDDPAATTGKTSDRTDVSDGRFVSLVPNKRIVQSVAFETNATAADTDMVVTWAFEPSGDGTQVAVTAENIPDSISEADHLAGLNASLDNLAAFLER